MQIKWTVFITAIFIFGGYIDLHAQPIRETGTVTLKGELKPVTYNAAGQVVSAMIYDEEWGLVLISNIVGDKTIFGNVGVPIAITGQLKSKAERGDGVKNELEVVSYRIMSLDQLVTWVLPTPTPPKTDDLPLEIIRGPRGEAISVIGHHDIGLNDATAKKADRVSQALRQFVLSKRDLFKFTDRDDVRFNADAVEVLVDGMHFAKVNQYMGNLRILDSEITSVLARDGSLESINGTVIPNRFPQASAQMSIDRIIEILRLDPQKRGSAASMGDMRAFKPDGSNRWRRDDGAVIEAGWSIRQDAAVWRAFLPREIVWIDDKSGRIVRRESQQEAVTGLVNVRHRNWPRSGASATALNEVNNSTLDEVITAEADEFFGNCSWHLQRQPFGFPHGIARIQDVNGGELERSQPCDSDTRPSFTQTNGDALREQGAFYVANQMRHFTNQNVWGPVPQNRDANVDFHMDDAGVSTAAYDNFFTSIRANPSFGQQDVLMHEYGHYVVWSYDDVSGNCIAGSDEGDSIDETLANVFGELFAADDPEINPQYGAISGFALGNGPTPHTNPGSIIAQAITCATANNPTDGAAFQQAVWELMFNRDCTIDACTAASGLGNRIWVGESEEAVLTHVGTALGRSLRVLGQNITHTQIRAQMIIRIRNDSGDGAANRARAVFRHHGI